jgi:hypothetical protein
VAINKDIKGGKHAEFIFSDEMRGRSQLGALNEVIQVIEIKSR